jgi:hypothetical protein
MGVHGEGCGEGVADGRYVLALVERLPQGAETIRRFARRR